MSSSAPTETDSNLSWEIWGVCYISTLVTLLELLSFFHLLISLEERKINKGRVPRDPLRRLEKTQRGKQGYIYYFLLVISAGLSRYQGTKRMPFITYIPYIGSTRIPSSIYVVAFLVLPISPLSPRLCISVPNDICANSGIAHHPLPETWFPLWVSKNKSGDVILQNLALGQASHQSLLGWHFVGGAGTYHKDVYNHVNHWDPKMNKKAPIKRWEVLVS